MTAPLAAAQAAEPEVREEKPSGIADEGEIEFLLTSPDEATALVAQTWTGEKAQMMRQSLDAFFGRGDKVLTADDIERIETASEDDLRNMTPPLFAFDGSPVDVTDVQIEILGAEGPIDREGDIEIQHRLELALTPAETEEHTLVVSPDWDGRLRVVPPDDFHVSDTIGLQTGPSEDGAIIGLMRANQDVAVTIAPGPAPVLEEEPEEAVEPAQPGESPDSIPGFAGVATLAAVGLAAALAVAARRRR